MLLIFKIITLSFVILYNGCITARTFDDAAVAMNVAKASETIRIILQDKDSKPYLLKVQNGLESALSQLDAAESKLSNRASINKYKVGGSMFQGLSTVINFMIPFCLGMIAGPVLCPKSWLKAIYGKRNKSHHDEVDS